MAKYNLFLDDIRDPSVCMHYKTKYMPDDRREYTMSEWTIVRNYKEFTEAIIANFSAGRFPGLVSFDHDLADIHYDPSTQSESFEYKEETGLDCARFLVQFCISNELNLPEFYVHSANPIGAENIYQAMHDYFKFKERSK
jgi:hypothetical protein